MRSLCIATKSSSHSLQLEEAQAKAMNTQCCQNLLCVLVAQLCPTLWKPTECSPQGSSVHGILQARILEWIAIPFSRGFSWPRDWTLVSCIAGRFFTVWAMGNILKKKKIPHKWLLFLIQRTLLPVSHTTVLQWYLCFYMVFPFSWLLYF